MPLRRVTPSDAAERFVTCVPLVDLKIAAGGWSEQQESVVELDSPATEWVTWDDPPKLAKACSSRA